MMKRINILVIGRHEQIMETVVRLINTQSSWNACGAINDERAIEIFNQDMFDLVLIGGGVDEVSEAKFNMEFEKINSQVKIIRHFGGGSGLLFNEIMEALRVVDSH